MRTLSVSSALVMVALVSCKTQRDNPNHCQNNDGNDWCAERFPDRPFCSIGSCSPDVEHGCLAARPEDDACYSPCGDDQTFEDDPSCDGVADSGTEATTLTSSSMSDTAPTSTTDDPTLTTSMSMSESESETESDPTSDTESTTGPTGCGSSEECLDPANPVCVDEVCSPCGEAPAPDIACMSKDPATPVCRDDGQCVQCSAAIPDACGDTTPVCDDASNTCVGCTYHEQCEGSACRMGTGACFDIGCVQTVSPGDGVIADAIMGGACVILLEPGAYDENVVLDSMDALAILTAQPMAFPVVTGDGDTPAPTIQLSGGAELYLDGLEISSNAGVGVSADGAGVWLDRTQVILNSGGGIALTGAASAQVRTCYVGGSSDVVSLQVSGTSSATVIYSTVGGSTGDATALSCDDTATVAVRDSIVVGRGPANLDITCDANITYSITEVLYDGTGNAAIGELNGTTQPMWFDNYGQGDFGLNTPPAVVESTAQWNTGDPATDINGDPRPDVPDAADFAGADIPL